MAFNLYFLVTTHTHNYNVAIWLKIDAAQTASVLLVIAIPRNSKPYALYLRLKLSGEIDGGIFLYYRLRPEVFQDCQDLLKEKQNGPDLPTNT